MFLVAGVGLGLGDIRTFFAVVDSTVYSLISAMYNIIIGLANYQFEEVDGFKDRIYALVGIFMLFKISFSFIQYIISPDSFVDKSKGFQKIIINIILVLTMLSVTPWAFDLLRDIQNDIILDNVLGNFFLGSDASYHGISSNDGKTSFYSIYEFDDEICPEYRDGENVYITNIGDYIALEIFTPFYSFNFKERGMNALIDRSDIEDKLKENWVNDMFGLSGICEEKTVAGLLNPRYFLDNWGLDRNNNKIFPYYIDYKFFISTLFGIVTLLFLISLAFDVATRTFKLYFLEMFAPVPIISYIEPDKSKSKMFPNWLKMVGTTWISLFIRLSALFLAIYIISNINSTLVRPESLGFFAWSMIKAFLIIGALIFAKQVPRLIEELTGLKLDHFELNPFKKLRNEALFGDKVANSGSALIGAGVGAAGSAISNGIAQASFRKKLGDEQSNIVNSNNKISDARIKYRNAAVNRNLAFADYLNKKKEFDSLNEKAQAAYEAGDWNELANINSRSYYAKQDLESKKQKYNSAVEEANKAKADALEIQSVEKANIEKAENKINELNNNNGIYTVAGAAAEIARGALYGAQHAYKSSDDKISKAVENGFKGTTQSTSKRNYREKFSLRDEINDRITTFAGVKNESGTSSEIAAKLKEKNYELAGIKNNIDQLNYALGNIVSKLNVDKQIAAQKLVSIDYKNISNIKHEGEYKALDEKEFNTIIETMKNISEKHQQMSSIEKEIKTYQDQKDSQSKYGNS